MSHLRELSPEGRSRTTAQSDRRRTGSLFLTIFQANGADSIREEFDVVDPTRVIWDILIMGKRSLDLKVNNPVKIGQFGAQADVGTDGPDVGRSARTCHATPLANSKRSGRTAFREIPGCAARRLTLTLSALGLTISEKSPARETCRRLYNDIEWLRSALVWYDHTSVHITAT
jgi:hypothetical protein